MYDKIDTLKTRIAREDGHGSKVFRWDFKPQTFTTNVDGTSFATFVEHFQKNMWPEFVEHHDLSVWQDCDWQVQKRNMPRGVCCVTIKDFPENYTHLMKREPQSGYWMQIQSGMYVCVAQFHTDGCNGIDETEKEALRKVFDENNELHFISETQSCRH